MADLQSAVRKERTPLDHEGRGTSLRYRPLDRESGEIRLIRLLPDAVTNGKRIFLEMFHTPLENTEFAALSYCWGDAEATEEIHVNGQALLIRKNLHSFLQQNLEYAKRPGMDISYICYWIDALCINQYDIDEKNHEVKRMDQIYATASTVFIWLGEGRTENSSTLPVTGESNSNMSSAVETTSAENTVRSFGGSFRKLLSRASSKTGGIFSHGKTGPHAKAFRVLAYIASLDEFSVTSESLRQPLIKAACEELWQMLMQPYFARAWCTQEAALANNLIVLQGDSALRWSTLHTISKGEFDWNAIRQELQLDERLSQSWNLQDAYSFWSASPFARVTLVEDLRQMATDDSLPSLLWLLIGTACCKSRHPIDKIYSLWSLACDASVLLPDVDYERSSAAVFTEFTRAWITRYGNLDVISTACVPTNDDSGEHMASWVTNWSDWPLSNPLISIAPNLMKGRRPESLEFDPIYNAHGGFGMSFAIEESRMPGLPWAETLIAAGLSCDVIEIVGEMHTTENGPLDDWGDLVMQAARRRDRSPANLDLWAEFWTTMFVGRDPKGFRYNVDRNSFRIGDSGMPILPWQRGEFDHSAWTDHPRRVTCGRHLVVTGLGALALVAGGAKVGDEICVIFGCSVPLILRRHQAHHFELIGDAYVDGWMEGQMIEKAGGERAIRANMPGVDLNQLAEDLTGTSETVEHDAHSEPLQKVMKKGLFGLDFTRTVVPPKLRFADGQNLSDGNSSSIYSADLNALPDEERRSLTTSFNRVVDPVTSETDIPQPKMFYIR